MTPAKQTKSPAIAQIEKVLIKGDLAGLTEDQRLSYVKAVCDSTGLNMLTKPFEFIQLNGKLVLYATRAATDQLRKIHKISIEITSREKVGDLLVVTAKAIGPKNRRDESIAAVNTKGLFGESLANAMMKAESKAKRRVTLSICGLGLLDESEAQSAADIEAEPQKRIERVAEKIETTQRPGFESEIGIDPVPEESPLDDHQAAGDYILRAGKIKGKVLKEMPAKKLNEWIDWYNQKTGEGHHFHEDVNADASAIQTYLEGLSKDEPNNAA